MKNRTTRTWLTAMMCAALLVAFTSGTVLAGYQVGDTVSDFTLEDPDGVSYSLSDYDGQIVVLVFFRNG